MTSNGVRIAGVKCLSTEQERQVQALRETCRSHEPVELPLFPNPLPPDSPLKTMFLAYAGEELVGFASLPVHDTPELVGAIHPDYRRRGIGRQLLAAAREEARRRGCADLILVCEAAAPAGLGFAQAVGSSYDCSEYQLERLRSAAAPQAPDAPPLEVVLGRREDASLLSQIGAESFGAGSSPDAERVARGFDNPKQRYYIAMANGEPVGSLRVLQDPGDATAHIYSFGVRHAYQRRGYGRRLLNTVVARLFAEGCEAVRLEVVTTNAPAFALYSSNGFHAVTEYLYFRIPA